jgi:hypothetical protein
MTWKFTTALAALVSFTIVDAAAAQTPTLLGSDTLFRVMQDARAACGGASTLSYAGGGCANGEAAMLQRSATGQYVAPMSRFLRSGAATCAATAQGYNFGLDAIAIVRDERSTVGCDTAAYARSVALPSGGTYTFRDFRDVLRIVYAGFDNTSYSAIAACSTGEPARSPISAQDCNSAVRQVVVSHWGNLFQNTSCGAGEACTQLAHAVRRSDASGTTDTLLALLALPAIAPNVKPFCNGSDHEDGDPIRRKCAGDGASGGEQVCEPREVTAAAFPASNTAPLGPPASAWEPAVSNTGDLGLVQDILIPEGVASSVAHQTTACSLGAFALAEMPAAYQLAGSRCPNGTAQVLLKCLYPTSAAGNFGCLNMGVNVPTIGELKRIDGRAYNLILRAGPDPDHNIVRDLHGTPVTGAFYRLHESAVRPGSSGVPCMESDSTAQIGCLVQASPCSIGFASREAADDVTIGNNGVRSLLLGAPDNSTAVAPTDAAVQALLGSCGGSVNLATRYPLARRLWLNTIGGFADPLMPADQQALSRCFADRTFIDPLLLNHHFVTLPEPAALGTGQRCATQPPGSAVCQLAATAASSSLCWSGSTTGSIAKAVVAPATVGVAPKTCRTAADCDDLLYCSGVETCSAGLCRSAAQPPCSGQVCDETAKLCRAPTTDQTITLDPTQTFQTISGWEAVAEAGQFTAASGANYDAYAAQLIDQAVNDLGITRLRVEVPSDIESTATNGNNYQIVNDNADPNVINWAGFQFQRLDTTMQKLVLPMKKAVEANGDKLVIRLDYVSFLQNQPSLHAQQPAEYAEFALAVCQHLRSTFNVQADAWEAILEPDTVAAWTAPRVGAAIVAASSLLKKNGFNLSFVAPSTTDMTAAIGYYDQIIQVPGVLGLLSELSYHRYGGVSDASLVAIGQRSSRDHIGTAMTEHIGSGYDDLYKDLSLALNTGWEQFVLAYPTTNDDGSQYYVIGNGSSANPQVVLGQRTKFLRQYFKFIRPGALRMQASSSVSTFQPLAFTNRDGRVVTVVKASGAGPFVIAGLASGKYGIKYTTDSAYNVDLPDQSVFTGQLLVTQIPAAGVITIYGK